MSDQLIPILVDDDFKLPMGRGIIIDDDITEASVKRASVAMDILQQNFRSVLRKTAISLGPSPLDGTDWRIGEVKIGLAIEANGEVSLLAVKGKAGAKATLEVTLRLG